MSVATLRANLATIDIALALPPPYPNVGQPDLTNPLQYWEYALSAAIVAEGGPVTYATRTVTDSLGTVITIPAGPNLKVSGSNSRGSWELWPDGTINQCGSFSLASSTFSGGPWSTGPFYQLYNLTYPIAHSAPVTEFKAATYKASAANFSWAGYATSSANGTIQGFIFNSVASDAGVIVHWESKGRYY